VIRRLALLPLALVATLSLVLAACSATPPAAPALTDPKDIVTKGVTSLVDIKTLEITGAFTGSVKAAQIGDFDLSSIKLDAAIDSANKTAKLTLDAPTLLGTKIDALMVGGSAYYKVAGLLSATLHATADKYTKVEVPTASGNPVADATDVTKLVSQLQDAFAKLPSPLTKAADEKCGDVDCYHVSTVVTAAQAKALDASSTLDGDITVDLFTHKSDYRPGRIAISIASPSMGTFGMTFDIKYDVAVNVTAPPADQIAP
jgi:hypothetical protein